jgi:phosphohistidine phosphatase
MTVHSPRARCAGGAQGGRLPSSPTHRAALVLCSTARRSTATLDAITPALEPDAEVRVEEGLYGASTAELVHRLHEIPAPVPSVLLIGHNPSIQSAAFVLAGSGDRALLNRLRDKMPTAALATLELDGDWSDLASGTTRLVSFVVPRELP